MRGIKKGGWVARLKKWVESKSRDHEVYNLSISGDTSRDVLRRFEFEMKQRIDEHATIITIFAIGINDSSYLLKENGHVVAVKEFKNNLSRIIDVAKKYTSRIVFVGLTLVDETKTSPIPWDKNKVYRNDYIKKYNSILKEVCLKNDVRFIDVLPLFQKTNLEDVLDEDGLHPNTKGHKLIFSSIKPIFNSLL